MAAVPVKLALKVGESTTLQGVPLTKGGDFRYNFGVVEVGGAPVTVSIVLKDARGARLGSRELRVDAQQPVQLRAEDLLPAANGATKADLPEDGVVEIAVASGDGAVVTWATQIANGSQDSTSFDLAIDAERLVGETGPAGPTGPTGPTGPVGLATVAATSMEPAGINCATGGMKVEMGLDANGDGTLDAGEVNAARTRSVCHGAQGPQGTPGPAGASSTDAIWGDGGDGALAIGGSVDWSLTPPPGTLQYSSITVGSGATLTVPRGLGLRSTGSVAINGTIVVKKNPVALSEGIGATRPESQGATVNSAGGMPVDPLVGRLLVNPSAEAGGYGGGNAGYAGAGGGAIVLLAKEGVSVGATGAIRADGTNGARSSGGMNTGGGGAGGIIVIASGASIANGGAISAVGGAGGPEYPIPPLDASAGGGGGGGIVLQLAPSISGASPTVSGGAAGPGASTIGFASGGGDPGPGSGHAGTVPRRLARFLPVLLCGRLVVFAYAGTLGSAFHLDDAHVLVARRAAPAVWGPRGSLPAPLRPRASGPAKRSPRAAGGDVLLGPHGEHRDDEPDARPVGNPERGRGLSSRSSSGSGAGARAGRGSVGCPSRSRRSRRSPL